MAILAIMFPVVLAIASYCINVSYMELARTELQITTDIATRAAGRTLAVSGSESEAILAAERMLGLNPFANRTLSINETNITFGVSTRYAEDQHYSFTTGDNPNAVRIDANGKVQVPALFPTLGVPMDFRPLKSAISTQVEIDLVLVMDRSGSMTYAVDQDSESSTIQTGWFPGGPVPINSRWLDAVRSTRSFIDLLRQTTHNEQLALCSYSSDTSSDVDLGTDYNLVNQQLEQLSLSFPGGSTNIGGGILEGAKALSSSKLARPWATRVMILLTDGRHNIGTDPIYAAQLAASQDILIYTVTFSDEADIAAMEQVASIGGGRHYHSRSGSELSEAFESILKNLPSLITF